MGFFQQLMDKITGNTEVPVTKPEIRQDTRNKVAVKMDELLQKNTNPVGFIYRTVMPTAMAAGTVLNPSAAIGGAVLGTAGGLTFNEVWKRATGKTWEEEAKDVVGRELAPMTNPGGLVGGAIGGTYGGLVRSRLTGLGIKFNNRPDISSLLKKGWMWAKDTKKQDVLVHETTGVETPNSTGTVTATGGVIFKPVINVNEQNPELHLNPNMEWKGETLINTTPVSRKNMREAKELVTTIGNNVPLSQSKFSQTKYQIIQKGDTKQKVAHVLIGKMPKEAPKIVEGYSTDIYPTMLNYANKGYGWLEKSATTRINGTNALGTTYSKLKSYFGEPQGDLRILKFRDMTPEQVMRWNSEMADQYGIHIDPITRTAEQYVFITGKKPKSLDINLVREGATGSVYGISLKENN